MTAEQYAKLKTVLGTFSNWDKLDYAVAKKLADAVPYIGRVRITSTWRSGTGGSMHQRTPALAIDFAPLQRPMWHVMQILRSLGWNRIGLSPAQNILHVDIGLDRGVATGPYFFYEDSNGKDKGPLTSQSAATLAAIPGYGTTADITAVASITPALSKFDPKTLLLVALSLGYAVSKIRGV